RLVTKVFRLPCPFLHFLASSTADCFNFTHTRMEVFRFTNNVTHHAFHSHEANACCNTYLSTNITHGSADITELPIKVSVCSRGSFAFCINTFQLRSEEHTS